MAVLNILGWVQTFIGLVVIIAGILVAVQATSERSMLRLAGVGLALLGLGVIWNNFGGSTVGSQAIRILIISLGFILNSWGLLHIAEKKL
jgi:hypothetical protein